LKPNLMTSGCGVAALPRLQEYSPNKWGRACTAPKMLGNF
jgi:hypothetical protein